MERKNKKAKSVGNGDGSLYYSETLQCWVYQYWHNYKRKTLKQRKKEKVSDFKARVIKLKNDLNNGTHIEKSQVTLSTIIEKHIKQKLKDGITQESAYDRDLNTLKQINKTCKNFINKPIQKITLNDIQEAKEEMKTYSQSSIDKMWQLLKKGFAIASSPSTRLIPFNIMNDENLIKPTSNQKTKKVYPLKKAEREKLALILDNEEKNHPYRDIAKAEWITSMRIGELLARSKDDLDKDITTLHIHNTLTKDKNGQTIIGKHTKTYDKETGIDKGERYFPIDAELKEIIARQLKNKIVNMYNLLFWDYKNNTFISARRVNDWLERINKKYEISDKEIHNHRLRHDRISQWKEAGMDMSAIQYLAGHVEGSNITDDVYIDVSKDFAFKQYQKII